MSVKHFVLDTNVLLHNPNALFVFEDNHIVIPYPVIEELDAMKRREDDVGRNARETIRQLDRLRKLGPLTEGVSLADLPLTPEQAASAGAKPPTGTVKIDVGDYSKRADVIAQDNPDNRIIAVADALKRAGERSVFVSKDLAARIKSDALNIKTEDFENQKVNEESLYTGFTEIGVPRDLIDDLYKDRLLDVARIEDYLPRQNGDPEGPTRELTPNQFVVMQDVSDDAHSGLARRLADTGHLIPVSGQKKPTFGIMARNVQQTMALDLLLDDEVRMVTLLGNAGTGKTLLAIAAGMAKVFGEER
ncbi:MAG: PIN domain-containing protein, partial [Planctomycetota bacterium]